MKIRSKPLAAGRTGAPRSRWVFCAVLLTFVFFLHDHDVFRAGTFEKGGYDTGEETAAATERGSIPRQLALLSLGVFGAVVLLQARRRNLRINGLLGYMIIFYLFWAVLSMTWADDSGLGLRRLVVLVLVWLGAFALAVRLSLREIMLLTFSICGVFLVSGICAEVALGTFHPLESGGHFARLETGYRFAGTIDPNNGAIVWGTFLLSAIVLAARAKGHRAFFVASAVVALLFLILTKTRTSFAAAILSMVVYGSLVTSWSGKRIAAGSLVVVVCILYFALGDEALTIGRSAALLGRRDVDPAYVSALSGRVPLWGELLSTFVAKHPFLGYGYGAFWTPDRVRKVALWRGEGVGGSTALNGYIDLALSLGLIGAGTYVLVLVFGIARALTSYKRSGHIEYAFVCILFLFYAVVMLSESINLEACLLNFMVISLLTKLGFERELLSKGNRSNEVTL